MNLGYGDWREIERGLTIIQGEGDEWGYIERRQKDMAAWWSRFKPSWGKKEKERERAICLFAV